MKVYWSRCGHGHGNFGDKITPLLLKRAGIPVEWAPPEHAELIGVGSILEKAPRNFRGAIWTTGYMHASSHGDFSAARVLAVRGHCTRERIGSSQVPVGDAGLLCDELVTSAAKKKHKLGIIPHFVDTGDALVRELVGRSSDIALIDICAEENEVLRAIASCENIISSSLHGLIVADSFGIPNRWLELNHGKEIVTGAGFKYRDYYSAFGIDAPPLHLDHGATLDTILGALTPYERPGISDIKRHLRETLEAIRQSVPPLTPAEISARIEAAADWQRRAHSVRDLVDAVVPPDAALLIADDEQVRSLIERDTCHPFIERHGQYWGPPGDAAEAIRELDRQIGGGAAWLVIAWPMFWLLEKFPDFEQHLRAHHHCVHATPDALLFALSSRPRVD